MLRVPSGVLALFLTWSAQAQGDRVALFVDGRAEDLITIHGKGRWMQDPGRVRVGVASLRVEAVATEKYPGFSVSNVPTYGGTALVLGVYLEGDQPRSYRIRIEDDPGDKDDAAIEYQTLSPGWNDVVVSLAGRRTPKGREMTFAAIARRLQFTKKNEPGDPAIVFDSVSVRGARPHRERRAVLDRYAAEKDLSRRVTALREIDNLAPQDVATFALDVLQREKEPRLRRVAREALARVAVAEVALGAADSVKNVPTPARHEVLWAVSAMPCRETRQRALAWVRDQKFTPGERTAILQGLRLAGGADIKTVIGDVPPAAPWPLRAALVANLRAVPDVESVDALIAILGDPGSTRVADDAEVALGALTGGDYGPDAATWRDWWRANREKTPLNTRTRARSGPYGKSTFYGLSVPLGRVVFVIDTSGSMAEAVGGGKLAEYMKSAGHLSTTGIRTRLDLAIAELTHAIQNMKDRTAVGVVSFAAAERWITKGLETVTPDLKAKIGERVHALSSGRSTNVYAGLFAAFHPEGKPRPEDILEGPDTVFLLTDGNPSSGKYSDIDDLRDEVLSWNLARAIRINCVNVGDTDARLLRALSYGSGGVFVDLKSERNDEEPPK